MKRNDPKIIMNGIQGDSYGLRGRIRRAIVRDQMWKLVALHLWRISFPIESIR